MRVCCGLTILAACAAPKPVSAVSTVDSCAPHDEAAVSKTMVEMYSALAADDLAAFRSLVAPAFYAFDGGERYDGDALAKLIVTMHAAGKRFVWTVRQPVVRFDCATAWITYSNIGAMGDATTLQPRTWLESALLRFADGHWRIEFFHSTRVPPPPSSS